MTDEPDDSERARDTRPGGRFRRMGRRVFGENDEGRSILGEAKEVFGQVLEGGDKARSELVRLVAREVRGYLDELGLKDDLNHLLTNYSLEVHASFNLRKLAESEKTPKGAAKEEEKE